MFKYPKKKAVAAMRAVSIKSQPLKDGTTLVVQELVVDPIPGNVDYNADYLHCVTNEGEAIRVPVREFVNMKQADGSRSFQDAETGEIMFPGQFTIKESEKRKAPAGSKVEFIYPVQAYVAGPGQIEARKFNFMELDKSGLRTDQTFEPVRDYTITTSF